VEPSHWLDNLVRFEVYLDWKLEPILGMLLNVRI